jgi:excisionase family DNA binding protein
MTDDFLLLDEVAELARVSVDTVRFWIRAGKLASVRPGRRRMVRYAVLEAFLQQDPRPASATRAAKTGAGVPDPRQGSFWDAKR